MRSRTSIAPIGLLTHGKTQATVRRVQLKNNHSRIISARHLRFSEGSFRPLYYLAMISLQVGFGWTSLPLPVHV